MSIAQNLKNIQDAILQVCMACNRSPQSVQLIAVSKTQTIEKVKEAADTQHLHFGENKVQEMEAKHAVFPHLHWHLIGTLQTNKVKYIVPYVYLIHSLDSIKLAAEINKQASKINRVIDCLLQINISDEPQKGGFQQSEARQLLQNISHYPFLNIKGLMGIAEDTTDKNKIQTQFKSLRQTQEQFQNEFQSYRQIQLRELSMGMTHDYPQAIAEGATYLRIGSAVFGSRN